MMYDISVAFGASNFVDAALPLARNLCVPLMPGSTRILRRAAVVDQVLLAASPPAGRGVPDEVVLPLVARVRLSVGEPTASACRLGRSTFSIGFEIRRTIFAGRRFVLMRGRYDRCRRR